jgi:ankyrin repeat protein
MIPQITSLLKLLQTQPGTNKNKILSLLTTYYQRIRDNIEQLPADLITLKNAIIAENIEQLQTLLPTMQPEVINGFFPYDQYSDINHGEYDILRYTITSPSRSPALFTPLCLAATLDKPEIAQLLLNHGANPSIPAQISPEQYKSPLYLATNKRLLSNVHLLIIGGSLIHCQTIAEQETPLDLAARLDDQLIFQHMLQSLPEKSQNTTIYCQEDAGSSVMTSRKTHIAFLMAEKAASCGAKHVLTYLLDNHQEVIFSKNDDDGQPIPIFSHPLYLAACHSQLETMALILSRDTQNTAHDIFAYLHEKLKLLFSQSTIITTWQQITELDSCKKIQSYLLTHLTPETLQISQLLTRQDINLHLLAITTMYENKPDLALALIQNFSSWPNKTINRLVQMDMPIKVTLLYAAIFHLLNAQCKQKSENPYLKIVHLLLKKGADPLSISHINGLPTTSIVEAIYQDDQDTLSLLISAIKPLYTLSKAKAYLYLDSSDKCTYLSYAIWHNKPTSATTLLNNACDLTHSAREIIELAKKRSTSPDIVYPPINRTFEHAINRNNQLAMDICLEYKDLRDDFARIAVLANSSIACKKLAKINPTCFTHQHDGKPLLWHACQNGNPAIIKLCARHTDYHTFATTVIALDTPEKKSLLASNLSPAKAKTYFLESMKRKSTMGEPVFNLLIDRAPITPQALTIAAQQNKEEMLIPLVAKYGQLLNNPYAIEGKSKKYRPAPTTLTTPLIEILKSGNSNMISLMPTQPSQDAQSLVVAIQHEKHSKEAGLLDSLVAHCETLFDDPPYTVTTQKHGACALLQLAALCENKTAAEYFINHSDTLYVLQTVCTIVRNHQLQALTWLENNGVNLKELFSISISMPSAKPEDLITLAKQIGLNEALIMAVEQQQTDLAYLLVQQGADLYQNLGLALNHRPSLLPPLIKLAKPHIEQFCLRASKEHNWELFDLLIYLTKPAHGLNLIRSALQQECPNIILLRLLELCTTIDDEQTALRDLLDFVGEKHPQRRKLLSKIAEKLGYKISDKDSDTSSLSQEPISASDHTETETQPPPPEEQIPQMFQDLRFQDAYKLIEQLNDKDHHAYFCGGFSRFLLQHQPPYNKHLQLHDIDIVTSAPPSIVAEAINKIFPDRSWRINQFKSDLCTIYKTENRLGIDINYSPQLFDKTGYPQSRPNTLTYDQIYVDHTGKIFCPVSPDTITAFLARQPYAITGDNLVEALQNNPMQILRVIYLSQELNLTLSCEIQCAIIENAEHINNLPHGQLISAIKKLFFRGHRDANFATLHNLGLLQYLFPPLYTVNKHLDCSRFVWFNNHLSTIDQDIRQGGSIKTTKLEALIICLYCISERITSEQEDNLRTQISRYYGWEQDSSNEAKLRCCLATTKIFLETYASYQPASPTQAPAAMIWEGGGQPATHHATQPGPQTATSPWPATHTR